MGLMAYHQKHHPNGSTHVVDPLGWWPFQGFLPMHTWSIQPRTAFKALFGRGSARQVGWPASRWMFSLNHPSIQCVVRSSRHTAPSGLNLGNLGPSRDKGMNGGGAQRNMDRLITDSLYPPAQRDDGCVAVHMHGVLYMRKLPPIAR